MTWVYRQHTCQPPTREVLSKPGPFISFQRRGQVPDGQVGDLWRCDDCGRLWRIGSVDPGVFGLSDREWCRAWPWQKLRILRGREVPSDAAV